MTHPRSPRRRPRCGRVLPAIAALALGASVLAACDSGGSATPPVPTTPPTTAAPTTQPQRVDLELTGNIAVSIHGLRGSCQTPVAGLPKQFIVTDPQLGADGYIVVVSTTTVPGQTTVPPSVKAYIKGVGMQSSTSGTGIDISPDRQRAEVDTDLSGVGGGTANGISQPGFTYRSHLSGTLRCT